MAYATFGHPCGSKGVWAVERNQGEQNGKRWVESKRGDEVGRKRRRRGCKRGKRMGKEEDMREEEHIVGVSCENERKGGFLYSSNSVFIF